MTQIDQKKEIIQQQALDAIFSNMIDDKIRATVEIITGLGKTFIALKTIQIVKPKNVLFLAETTMRENDIKKDIEKFKQFYNYDLNQHNIEYKCYQGAYKEKDNHYDFVVADEIHDGLTPIYYKFFENNTFNHLLCLSATIDEAVKYKKNEEEFTKKDLLNKIAPIVFKYTTNDGQKDGTSRKLIIHIIHHSLDNVNKSIEIKYKKNGQQNSFFTTEEQAYKTAHDSFIKSIFSKSDFLIRYWAARRANLLYNLPSKTKIVENILKTKNRTIVFGNSINKLEEICPTVSSKNSKEVNNKIIDDFNNGIINVIASFKMLKQGITLNNLNNVIFHSYYKSQKDAIQRWGRLRYAEEEGHVYIIVTSNTQEEKWLDSMLSNFNNFTIKHETSKKWMM